MSEGFALYQRNGFELRVVEDSPANEHIELWVDGELVAIIDTLGILQPGDDAQTAYVELRLLHGHSIEAIDDDDSTSFLYEVG